MGLSDFANLPWGTIIPVGISLAALAVSIFTWYSNDLAPFRPLTTIGFPIYNFASANPDAPGVAEYN
jgi:hypothetical protein